MLLCRDTLPAALVMACERGRPTLLYGSPLQFARMASALRRDALASVRLALSTSAALPEQVAADFEAAGGVPLGQAYGIIEAGLPCINMRAGGEPATSVGRAGAGVRGGGSPAQTARPLPAGQPGEVDAPRSGTLHAATTGPGSRATRSCVDGWFVTGDVGTLDASGPADAPRTHASRRSSSRA